MLKIQRKIQRDQPQPHFQGMHSHSRQRLSIKICWRKTEGQMPCWCSSFLGCAVQHCVCPPGSWVRCSDARGVATVRLHCWYLPSFVPPQDLCTDWFPCLKSPLLHSSLLLSPLSLPLHSYSHVMICNCPRPEPLPSAATVPKLRSFQRQAWQCSAPPHRPYSARRDLAKATSLRTSAAARRSLQHHHTALRSPASALPFPRAVCPVEPPSPWLLPSFSSYPWFPDSSAPCLPSSQFTKQTQVLYTVNWCSCCSM